MMTQEELFKEINKLIDKLCYKQTRWEIISDVVEIGALCIANRVDKRFFDEREKRYFEIKKKYDKQEMDLISETFGTICALLANMSEQGFDDWLGKLYMMSGTSSDNRGQFFTPFNVSQLCAEVAFADKEFKDNEVITFGEEACGSGGMILAAAEVLRQRNINYCYNFLVECGDIDSRCVHMCYLQLALAGIPAVVRHMNTLTMEIWSEWHTPALCINWLRFRPYLRKSDRKSDR